MICGPNEWRTHSMKSRIQLGLFAVVLIVLFGNLSNAAPGDVDLSFGTNGKAYARFSPTVQAFGFDAVIDALQGKITVAGELVSAGNIRHIGLARFDLKGRLDTS